MVISSYYRFLNFSIIKKINNIIEIVLILLDFILCYDLPVDYTLWKKCILSKGAMSKWLEKAGKKRNKRAIR